MTTVPDDAPATAAESDPAHWVAGHSASLERAALAGAVEGERAAAEALRDDDGRLLEAATYWASIQDAHPASAPDGTQAALRRYARRVLELVPEREWQRRTEEERLLLLDLADIASGPRVGVLGPSLARHHAERAAAGGAAVAAPDADADATPGSAATPGGETAVDPGALAHESLPHRVLAALRHPFGGRPDVLPRTVIAFPYYPNNPFQSIVYGDLGPDFALVAPGTVAELFAELAATDTAGGTAAHTTQVHRASTDAADSAAAGRAVTAEPAASDGTAATGGNGATERILHLNWTAPIVQYAAETAEEAEAAVDAFLAALDDFITRGGTLVWTVHNTLPHELRFREAELRLSRGIVQRAALVITLNPQTSALVAGDYPLPEAKTVVQPHPSYRGLFADTVDRDEARRMLGIAPGAEVLLLFGTIRPYKGVERVLDDVMRARARRPDLVLLVAGEIGPGFTDDELRALFDFEGVKPFLRYVPSDDTQYWFRSADAVLLPYRAALNPSLVYLAATFGVPVLLSALPSLGYLFEEPWVHPVDFEEPVDLVTALDGIAAEGPEARAAARDFAARTAPALAAARFVDALRALP
ncbi:glycosyltransferase [Herbiconiux sp. 11R-BC]|uniref:glycosyltransferase n=1 Tax=Herbiconiux sp. 11R-BC TaxID=3111637 RepID=UPI003C01282C